MREDIEPLDVMVDGARLLIMRGSRRGAMLSSLQGMCIRLKYMLRV